MYARAETLSLPCLWLLTGEGYICILDVLNKYVVTNTNIASMIHVEYISWTHLYKLYVYKCDCKLYVCCDTGRFNDDDDDNDNDNDNVSTLATTRRYFRADHHSYVSFFLLILFMCAVVCVRHFWHRPLPALF